MTDRNLNNTDELAQKFPDLPIPDDLPEDLSQNIRTTGEISRIVVDRQGCIGARSCALIAEKVFIMDDENLAYVGDDLNDTDDETIKMAAQSCPVLAVHLYNKKGEKVFPEE
jgi:ferredoxin